MITYSYVLSLLVNLNSRNRVKSNVRLNGVSISTSGPPTMAFAANTQGKTYQSSTQHICEHIDSREPISDCTVSRAHSGEGFALKDEGSVSYLELSEEHI